MKKLFTAVVAALMVAGSLSAISGASSVSAHARQAIVIEGPSPSPLLAQCDLARTDAGSPNNQ